MRGKDREYRRTLVCRCYDDRLLTFSLRYSAYIGSEVVACVCERVMKSGASLAHFFFFGRNEAVAASLHPSVCRPALLYERYCAPVALKLNFLLSLRILVVARRALMSRQLETEARAQRRPKPCLYVHT